MHARQAICLLSYSPRQGFHFHSFLTVNAFVVFLLTETTVVKGTLSSGVGYKKPLQWGLRKGVGTRLDNVSED